MVVRGERTSKCLGRRLQKAEICFGLSPPLLKFLVRGEERTFGEGGGV